MEILLFLFISIIFHPVGSYGINIKCEQLEKDKTMLPDYSLTSENFLIEKDIIKYWIDKQQFSEKDQNNIDHEAKKAFDVYATKLGPALTFYKASSKKEADIKISFVDFNTLLKNYRDGEEKDVAKAFINSRTKSCDIYMHSKVTWNFESMDRDGVILFYIPLVHVIGHCVGLGHSYSSKDVMFYPPAIRHNNLGKNDEVALQHVSGQQNDKHINLCKESKGLDFEVQKGRATTSRSQIIVVTFFSVIALLAKFL